MSIDFTPVNVEMGRFHNSCFVELVKGNGITFLQSSPIGATVENKLIANTIKLYGKDVMVFDPTSIYCAKFNPLAGLESDVSENIETTFKMLNPDTAPFSLALNERLLRNAVKVLKRLDASEGMAWEGKYANLINLGRLLRNSGGQGLDMVQRFCRIVARTPAEAMENMDIATWFINDYFPEQSKVYEDTSGVRAQVANLVSNECLREVMNPDVEIGEHSEIDFDKHLKHGTALFMTTARYMFRDLSDYLGCFLVLALQSAMAHNFIDGKEGHKHYLCVNEYQQYFAKGIEDMLGNQKCYFISQKEYREKE